MNRNFVSFALLTLSVYFMCDSGRAETTQESRELVLRFVNNFWNAKDISVVDELIAQNFTN